MAWVYLDDQFPDHPKVVTAGDDAAWMFVCGLAYCRRYSTGGRIPKGQVQKLTGHRQPAKLAKRLLEVVLWEDGGDDYVVHDYDDWNKPQASRTEAARKAARARWGTPKGDANAHADALPDASQPHSDADADRSASECPPPTPSVVTSTDNSRRLGGDASDDDDPRVQAAVLLLAQSDLDERVRVTAAEKVRDPRSWLREAVTRRSERNTTRLLELAQLDPDAGPEQLVAALNGEGEPDVTDPPSELEIHARLDGLEQVLSAYSVDDLGDPPPDLLAERDELVALLGRSA